LHFIKFCIKHQYFDDTFFDYSNIFSIVATKLPMTFKKICGTTTQIQKSRFNEFFKKSKYKGDMEFIYSSFDTTNKGFISWSEFRDFFLPFVRNVTM
jgi:hypothetical protein